MCKMRVKSQKAEKLKTFALLFYLKRNIIEWIRYHIGKVMDFYTEIYFIVDTEHKNSIL